jgi:hypothetical protein
MARKKTAESARRGCRCDGITLSCLAVQLRHSYNQTRVNLGDRNQDEYKRKQEFRLFNPVQFVRVVELQPGEDLTSREYLQVAFYSDRYLTH